MSGELSSDSAYLYAYGTYLANGGRREDFLDLSLDEIQLIYTVTTARQEKQMRDHLNGLVKILSKMFAGENRW